jgi:hypothetical protein
MTMDALQQIWKSYLHAYAEISADERELSAGRRGGQIPHE